MEGGRQLRSGDGAAGDGGVAAVAVRGDRSDAAGSAPMDAATMAAVDANVAEWSAVTCGGEVVDARRAAGVAVDATAAAPPPPPLALAVCAYIAAAAATAGIASAACCNNCCANRVWSRAWSGVAAAPRDECSGSSGGGGGPTEPAAIQAEADGARVEDAEAACAGVDVAAATLPGDKAAALIDDEAADADEATATADADEDETAAAAAASPLVAAID